MKRRSGLIVVLAGLAVLGAGLAGRLGVFKARTPVPAEKIVKVQRGDIARSVVAVGRIEPRSRVEVKSKANGIIKSLHVDVGDRVREGQVLVELDKENLEAQVREAQATRDAERANLEMALAAETRARIEAANPELEFATRDYRRLETLSQQGIASQQALDDAQRGFEIARNRQELLGAEVLSAAARVTQAHARVAAAVAALDRAQENLRHATICAAMDGMVLTRDTEIGDAVSSILNLGSAATLILTLGDLSTLYVRGEVDEADVGRIAANLPARTTVESFPEERFAGSVTRIAPMGRAVNNVTTFEVRISIADPEGKLRVNMSANAEIVLEEHRDVLLVPEGALRYDPDRSVTVQVLDPSAREGSRQQVIRVGLSNGRLTEVLEGLGAGDAIVLP